MQDTLEVSDDTPYADTAAVGRLRSVNVEGRKSRSWRRREGRERDRIRNSSGDTGDAGDRSDGEGEGICSVTPWRLR